MRAPKILCLTQHDLDGPETGAALRARNVFKLLARLGEVRVALASFHQSPGAHPNGTCGGFELLRALRFQRTPRISLAARLRHQLDPRFMNLNWIEAQAEDRAWLEQAVAEHDLVWVHSLDLANYFGRWHWPRAVLDIDDIPSEYSRSRQRVASGLGEKIHWARDAAVCRRHEKMIRERFEAVCVCSETDQQVLGWPEKTFVVPNGFEPSPVEIVRTPGRPPRLGFIGNIGYEPNREGAWWFVKNVWPLIRKKNPDARLRVAGAEGEQQNWPAGQGIEALGRVADVAGEMATWNLTVVPIHIGGGTRVKMAEAFSRRCPVVATPLGAYGYAVADGRDLFIADAPVDFADKCLRLLDDDALGRTLAESAWQKFLKQWTWEAQAGRVAAAANHVLKQSSAH